MSDRGGWIWRELKFAGAKRSWGTSAMARDFVARRSAVIADISNMSRARRNIRNEHSKTLRVLSSTLVLNNDNQLGISVSTVAYRG